MSFRIRNWKFIIVVKHIPTNSIKQEVKNLGFDLVGITSAEPVDSTQIEYFEKWLAAGCYGTMGWLANNIEKRFNPALLLEGAKSVICTALNYKPSKTSPKIASYALYEDYHNFIKDRLFKLADFLKSISPQDFKFKVCIDSAPLAERALAARAGLGFIGKNHLLTNPRLGSFLLLGELITNLPLEADEPLDKKDFCKGCTKCINACPCGVFGDFFDARKCISYLTIEHKGEIPQELAVKIRPHLFGCDECILACPYNEKAPVCANKDFKFFADRLDISAEDLIRRLLLGTRRSKG
ncbi:MAG: tRNA epoxyqueuosine(34) reductase QueG [Planctomycetes bacterium RBG_13_44_8b]|nr:MAG: tRNA epoxyqueuosine(34) reductase QueG [Planctomycetes bacterium RBG_13_44_8b]